VKQELFQPFADIKAFWDIFSGFRMALRHSTFTFVGYANGGLALDGAFGFANSAANAQGQVHIGKFDSGLDRAGQFHVTTPENDGFFRHRTMFFADDTIFAPFPGYAPRPVDIGQSDDSLLFGCFCQWFYSARRADLPAQGAGILAITFPHAGGRCP
jgi:hypothetical protein